MTHPEQIIDLVHRALALETRAADAAALLADAAAFLAVDSGASLLEMTDRLSNTYAILEQAKDVAATGSRRSH